MVCVRAGLRGERPAGQIGLSMRLCCCACPQQVLVSKSKHLGGSAVSKITTLRITLTAKPRELGRVKDKGTSRDAWFLAGGRDGHDAWGTSCRWVLCCTAH